MFKGYRFRRIIKQLFDYEHYRIIVWKLWDFASKTNPLRREKYYAPYLINGERKDRKYVVIRVSQNSGVQIMSFAKMIPHTCEWAESKGFIPIMYLGNESDLKKYDYSNNFIDLFFCQEEITDIQENNYIFFEQLNYYPDDDKMLDCDIIKLDLSDNWRKYYSDNYKYVDKWLSFKPDFLKKCDFDMPYIDEYSIGVSFNENFIDDVYNKVCGLRRDVLDKHPMSAGIADLISCIDEMISEKTSCIFISCMMEDTIETLSEKYGDKIKYLKRNRKTMDEFVEYVSTDETEKNQSIDKCYSYVEEVVGLSRCGAIVGNISSGLTMAMAFNGGKYTDIKIMDPIRGGNYTR